MGTLPWAASGKQPKFLFSLAPPGLAATLLDPRGALVMAVVGPPPPIYGPYLCPHMPRASTAARYASRARRRSCLCGGGPLPLNPHDYEDGRHPR